MKNICVYCGSSPGRKPVFTQAAQHLARELSRRGIGLVYGGANVGLMGELANTVLAEGGEVTGIIPQQLVAKEISHQGLTTLHVVDSMHARKAMMEEVSDGFIALPGGLGTVEELFEVMTWAQLGFHTKPCGLLNVSGYYDHLTHFLQNAVNEQFVQQAHGDMLLAESDPALLLDAMAVYSPPIGDKWLGRGEI